MVYLEKLGCRMWALGLLCAMIYLLINHLLTYFLTIYFLNNSSVSWPEVVRGYILELIIETLLLYFPSF